MSQQEPTRPYVFQPEPVNSPLAPLLFAVAGPGSEAHEGMRYTKEQAAEIVRRLIECPDVWVEDRDWRVVPESSRKRCRRKHCTGHAVAEVYRRNPWNPTWWAYCVHHLAGRKVEGGKVLICVPGDSTAAAAGYFALNGLPPAPEVRS